MSPIRVVCERQRRASGIGPAKLRCALCDFGPCVLGIGEPVKEPANDTADAWACMLTPNRLAGAYFVEDGCVA